MGVFINACKLKEKVGGKDWISNPHRPCNGEETIIVWHCGKDDGAEFVKPFEVGVYTYESGKHCVSMSYGGNADFWSVIDYLCEEYEDYNAFSVSKASADIEGCVSYEVAEKMLAEFQEYEKVYKAERCFINHYGDDYGEFLYGCYEQYIKVLKECIEMKGVIRYS